MERWEDIDWNEVADQPFDADLLARAWGLVCPPSWRVASATDDSNPENVLKR